MIEQVGRYRVVGNLGKGAMGIVLLAEDPLLNRRVAIKMLDLTLDDPERRSFLHDRLLRDARAAAALTHPNIVSVYDVVEQGDSAYLVLEYISGESLAQRLSAGPPPEPAFALRVLREMAAALDYTHERGIIHRDIKPANVMLDAAGSAKIMDFGIARISDARTGTPTGMVMGTIEYMAPEQIKGEPVDGRADQFSLAGVAYEMFTGSTLYGQHSFTTLAYKVVHEMPPPARTHRPDLPVGVDEVLARALRKSPAERYSTCGEFIRALERAFSGEVVTQGATTKTMVRPTAATTQTMVAPARKRSGAMAAVAGAAAAIGIGVGLFLWKPWESRVPLQVAPSPTAESTAEGSSAKRKVERRATKSKPEAPPVVSKAPSGTPSGGPPTTEPPAPSIPPQALAAYNVGLDHFNAGEYSAAVQSYTQAIRLKADYLQAYVGRAQALMHQNLLDEAIQDLTFVAQRNGRHHFAFALRGQCHLRQKQYDLALADFNRSMELLPSAMALNGRGAVALDQNQYQKAIADFNAALQLQPDFEPAYVNRRKAEIALGDKAGARSDNKKIQELNGGRKSAQE